MFETCYREYYYRYVLYYDVPFGHEIKSITGMTKEMYNIDFFLGNIVHAAIENQLNQISRGREVPDSKPAINYISRIIEEAIEKPHKFFIESLNGEAIEADRIAEFGREAERQIKIFFSEYFDFYKGLEFITHERFSDFQIEDQTFWVKPDLITRSLNGHIYITDWKTNSKYEHAVDPFQMNLYILWAIAKGHGPLADIRGEVIFLDVGKSQAYKVSQKDLDSFKVHIVAKSRELFNEIDSRNSIEDFPKCSDTKTCVSCGYYQYCKIQD
jgi:CRISPR/Cas system-associated exonuclease Cas4 (RecB family)